MLKLRIEKKQRFNTAAVALQDNDYNEAGQYIAIVLLCLSLVACISCIVMSFEIYAQTFKVGTLIMLEAIVRPEVKRFQMRDFNLLDCRHVLMSPEGTC